MIEQAARVFVDDRGQLEIVDPRIEDIDFLHKIDPGFTILSSDLEGFTTPRFQKARLLGCTLTVQELENTNDEQLWHLHDQLMEQMNGTIHPLKGRFEGEMSLLDLKVVLAGRLLKACCLCGHRCGVDRTNGERGICGLTSAATFVDAFIHIAEEPQINPSLLVSVGGCGLRCRLCQQESLLGKDLQSCTLLNTVSWLPSTPLEARSLSFIGGNPDESLRDILSFLKRAPKDFGLPIVWNCNGYGSIETVRLLNGIVDVYLPDFKFGSNTCAGNLSTATDYVEIAKTAVTAMVAQKVPVIVRVLILPGHLRCCHFTTLEYLSQLSANNLTVSIRGQYRPNGSTLVNDPDMNRRVNPSEVTRMYEYADELNLLAI